MDHSLLSMCVLIYCALILTYYASIISADTQSVYVVMLKDPPVSQLLSEVEIGDEIVMTGFSEEEYELRLTRSHDSLLENAFGKGNFEKVYSYNYLINGFSALLSVSQVETLSKLPEVVRVEKDIVRFEKLTTYTPTYIGLENGAWNKCGGSKEAGEGIVIGLVDTGIDPTHPSFKDDNYPRPTHYRGSCQTGKKEFPDGSCSNKLVGAQYFAKGAIASGEFNESIHYASPIDGEGHGTHTSATAAGNYHVNVTVDGMSFGFASGMAPRAHIAMYRALYPDIGGTLSDVVAAIEKATKDKVDILSLSIGPGLPPNGPSVYVNIFDMAMLAATNVGVLVIQAAGNAGPYPFSIASFSPWILSVAASMHDRTYPNSITLGNRKTIKGNGIASPTSGDTMYGLVLADDALKNPADKNTNTNPTDCQDASLFEKEMVTGKLLICNYSINFAYETSSIDNVINTVNALSAKGVVMVISPDLVSVADELPLVLFTVPAIIVPNSDDIQAILDYYKTANSSATAKIHGATVNYSKEAPKVASYSSRGPSPLNDRRQTADILKPNVMAPGSMIWAAWSHLGGESPEFKGQNFAIISGTSMATPHIAGIAALLKQKNPRLSPAAISSALATTAYITGQDGKPLLAQKPSSNITQKLGPATPFDFGGGEVNTTAALDPGLVFDAGYEDYRKFLCSIPGSASEVNISCPPKPGMPTDLNLPSITIANLAGARVFPRKVTNVASSPETYKVQIIQPKEAVAEVNPAEFTIAAGATESLNVTLTPSTKSATAQFGYITLMGSHGHVVRVPISIASFSAP